MASFGVDAAWGLRPSGPAPAAFDDYKKHTMSPTTTATSVIALKFDKGVIMAADVLGSYGSLARFRDCPRLLRLNENIVVGASGDYADFQYMKEILERKIIEEECIDDDIKMKPKSLHCWLTRILYQRRSKFDPLWNTYVVAGMENDKPFLGAVDMIGTAFENDCIGTGYGAYIALPLMREHVEKKEPIDEAKAREIIKTCMETLYYRDARSFPKYQVAVITADGAKVEDVVSIVGNWSIAHLIKGY